jgi:hypothetical protein
LSWHTSKSAAGNQDASAQAQYVKGGWRSGNNTSLNDSQVWQRYVLVQDNIAPVPEPETYAMLLAGLAIMGAAAARRRKAQLADQLAA